MLLKKIFEADNIANHVDSKSLDKLSEITLTVRGIGEFWTQVNFTRDLRSSLGTLLKLTGITTSVLAWGGEFHRNQICLTVGLTKNDVRKKQ